MSAGRTQITYQEDPDKVVDFDLLQTLASTAKGRQVTRSELIRAVTAAGLAAMAEWSGDDIRRAL